MIHLYVDQCIGGAAHLKKAITVSFCHDAKKNSIVHAALKIEGPCCMKSAAYFFKIKADIIVKTSDET